MVQKGETNLTDQIVSELLEEVSAYAKDNMFVLPKVQSKFSKRKGGVDPYKDKQMTYITEEDKNFEPQPEDEFFITSGGTYQRKIFGAPVVIEPKLDKEWQEFAAWFQKRNGRPVPAKYFDQTQRLGHRQMYYRFHWFEMAERDILLLENISHRRNVTAEM